MRWLLRRTSKRSTTTAGAFAIIASLRDMLGEAEKRKSRAARIKAGRKSKPGERMEGHAMPHNDYFADGATHADNFRRRCKMSKGLFMNILHGVRDDYLRMSESAIECMYKLCRSCGGKVWQILLERANEEETARIMAQNAARGFPGMLGSIDCMAWKNCRLLGKRSPVQQTSGMACSTMRSMATNIPKAII
ncbi:hypothetical protein QYE76_054892 [Lolium multiflorum]|uniref:Uncharacterized protein n=1 Tax=Lolium multiflorum TaxID=4521 RepID=A0AAD8SYK4_LOLMU|nr:hypothetical protein QYE76_054892 [Lolium multiflorum]